ncbi:MAG: pyruvate dehydrogenase (acetyl-transferring) E1 component subunit alpha [Armatimonadota bacterium]|nr:pyruvate dehydrogenase (acetyl-transferring) E1 component subunit alpha [Armatimonadota bacterium]
MTRLLRLLDPEGNPTEPVRWSRDQLVQLYRWMVLGRVLDLQAVALQRQGWLGAYAPFAGQEAAVVGTAAALSPQDWIFPTYRDILAGVLHGVPLARYLLLFRGHPMGNRVPDGVNVFPVQISIAAHIPHAVGAAWAAAYRGDRTVVMVYFGDGATSKGDFHEALNFAGVLQCPVVFVCVNNGWAISVPRSRQTASETLAQKAQAYGFPGVLVDGMDILATYEAARAAVARARADGGPTLLEAVCYRFGPHTTADDPSRYRSEEEVESWKALDPLARLRRYLFGHQGWTEEEEAGVWEQARSQVARAVEEAEAHPAADPAWMFDHSYAVPPESVRDQRRTFLEDG